MSHDFYLWKNVILLTEIVVTLAWVESVSEATEMAHEGKALIANVLLKVTFKLLRGRSPV